MAYNLAIRLTPEPLRSLAFDSIDNTYMGIGTGFDHPIRIIFIQNLTDQTLMFSFDGINDHFPLAENAFLLLDVTTNKTISQGCFIAEGQRLYVKIPTGGVAPTTNGVYVTVFYGVDN